MGAPAGTRELFVQRLVDGRLEPASDAVVVEEPLEIRLGDQPVAVTMRTPGHDVELGVGFLVSEGVVDPAAVATAAHCRDAENALEVRLEAGSRVELPPARRFYASSSCGVCGKASIDDVRVRAPSVAGDATRVRAATLAALPARLRAGQILFAATGALHAAGLFSPDGELVCVREDVGRHNAVDKIVGWAALRDRLPLAGHVLLVSGRPGFEIAQKALVAGIPVVAGISGASSLAIGLAEEAGMTLVAFLRESGMNVCAHAQRIDDS